MIIPTPEELPCGEAEAYALNLRVRALPRPELLGRTAVTDLQFPMLMADSNRLTALGGVTKTPGLC